jgi:hypothetical protein
MAAVPILVILLLVLPAMPQVLGIFSPAPSHAQEEGASYAPRSLEGFRRQVTAKILNLKMAIENKKNRMKEVQAISAKQGTAPEREALQSETALLEKRVADLEGELDDIYQASIPREELKVPANPVERKALISEREGMIDLIMSVKSQIVSVEESKRNTEEWAREYPAMDWTQQIADWNRQGEELRSQLRSFYRQLGRLALPEDFEPSAGRGSGRAKRRLPKMLPAERERWHKRGFSNAEIDTLMGGGIVTDSAGKITGWPPSRLKKPSASTGR